MNRYFTLLLVSLLYVAVCNAAVAKPACGGSTSSKDVQLLTPANPPRECIYRIKATSNYVTQLRIDFAMNLAQPSLPAFNNDLSYAKCVIDYFQVGDLRLCGIETKQHIYVPFNRTAGVTSVELSLVIAARAGSIGLPKPTWDIKVTQLESPAGAAVRSADFGAEDLKPSMRATIKDGFFIAPPGCLQYFPQAKGVVTSFNYNQGQGVYPGNLNYAICFRRQSATDGLELKAQVFNLGSKNQVSKYNAVDNNCYSEHVSESTNEDYLMVPQGAIKNRNLRATYFCGESIDGETVLSTNPGPLLMVFNSDAHHSLREAGFYFSYSLV